MARDAVRLASLLPADCSGIVGIPRSGMIPASILATHLHLPLYELAAAGPRQLVAGSRGGHLLRASGPLAVVDDTVYGGHAMRRARQAMKGHRAVYAAVYVRPEVIGAVDVYAVALPCPHILAWNLFNCGIAWGNAAPSSQGIWGEGIASDLDGILLHDEHSGGRLGAPYLLPRFGAIPLIVTGRNERSRAGTVQQLERHGVRYRRLEMLPDEIVCTTESAAAHKAHHYAASSCGFFVESCPEQAELIFRRTQRPVICPIVGKVWQ